MLKKGCILILVLLATILSACSSPTDVADHSETALSDSTSALPTENTTPVSSAPNDTQQWPTYRIEAAELPVNIRIPEGCSLELKDMRNGLLLFAMQEKQLDTDKLFAFFLTRFLGVYDTTKGEVIEQWEPQEPGWYFAGAFCGASEAVFARIDDYFNAIPSEYSVVSFGADSQETLQSFSGEIQVLQHLDDTALFSYYDSDGNFGVRSVDGSGVSDVLQWKTDQDRTMPLGGDLSVCGERFTYACVQGGQCVLLTADLSGELSRAALEYQTEKLDNLCLTPHGVVASLSLNEGTPDARRELVLFHDSGERYAVKSYGALYRMAFSNIFGCAVDSFYQPYLITAAEDRIACRMLSDELPEEMQVLAGNPVFFFRGDDHTLYFYYTELQRLFQVFLAPAA